MASAYENLVDAYNIQQRALQAIMRITPAPGALDKVRELASVAEREAREKSGQYSGGITGGS